MFAPGAFPNSIPPKQKEYHLHGNISFIHQPNQVTTANDWQGVGVDGSHKTDCFICTYIYIAVQQLPIVGGLTIQ